MSKVNRRDFVQNLSMTAKRMHCKMHGPHLQRRGIVCHKYWGYVIGGDLLKILWFGFEYLPCLVGL